MIKETKYIRYLFHILKVLCLILILNAVPLGSQEVYAATKTVKCTDKSGNYIKVNLKPSGNVYTLYNNKKQPLTGVQYIKVPTIENEINSGYYMFDNKGVLIRQRNVYKITKTKVNGVLFNGYYYTTQNGKFMSYEYGLCSISKKTCNGYTFNGIFYLQKYGKLNANACARYIESVKKQGVTYESGYYWFNSKGQLITTPGFHAVHEKINKVSFKGTFYFGGKNGMLLLHQAGLREINGKMYYLSKWGRRAENSWAKGHYFLSNGVMAVNMKLPDGNYVDEQGNKVSASDFETMKKLKQSVETITQRYSGTWSVYVKNLNTGASFLLNDTPMYAASTIKPFIMASTFNLINQNKLKYNSEIKELMWYMITESDNQCANELTMYNSTSGRFLDGLVTINKYLENNGYKVARMHNSLQSTYMEYISDGRTTQMCASDAGLLLERIYNGTCVNETYSKEMLRLLLNQQRRWKIPAGVPAGVKVANKTGENTSTEHDMAIVFGPKTTYILCVFTTNATEYYGIEGIKAISKEVYNSLNK